MLSHARALLTSTPQGACDYLHADLRDPQAIVRDAARTLDLTRPVAVLLLAVLHFIPDADNPPGIVAALAAALAPGSFVAISHLTSDFAPGPVTCAVAAYNNFVPSAITPRSHAQITAMFDGLALVAPGIVPVTEWRPGPPAQASQTADLYAGLATTRPSR